MFQSYLKSYKKMFDFKGRSSRKEYWSNLLVDWVVFLGFLGSLIPVLLNPSYMDTYQIEIMYIYRILTFLFIIWLLTSRVVKFALQVRRLHDVGYPGWLALAHYVSFMLFANILLDALYFSDSSVEGLANRSFLMNTRHVISIYINTFFLSVASLISLFVFVLSIRAGDPNENLYGPCPKKEIPKTKKAAPKQLVVTTEVEKEI